MTTDTKPRPLQDLMYGAIEDALYSDAHGDAVETYLGRYADTQEEFIANLAVLAQRLLVDYPSSDCNWRGMVELLHAEMLEWVEDLEKN